MSAKIQSLTMHYDVDGNAKTFELSRDHVTDKLLELGRSYAEFIELPFKKEEAEYSLKNNIKSYIELLGKAKTDIGHTIEDRQLTDLDIEMKRAVNQIIEYINLVYDKDDINSMKKIKLMLGEKAHEPSIEEGWEPKLKFTEMDEGINIMKGAQDKVESIVASLERKDNFIPIHASGVSVPTR